MILTDRWLHWYLLSIYLRSAWVTAVITIKITSSLCVAFYKLLSSINCHFWITNKARSRPRKIISEIIFGKLMLIMQSWWMICMITQCVLTSICCLLGENAGRMYPEKLLIIKLALELFHMINDRLELWTSLSNFFLDYAFAFIVINHFYAVC